MRYPGSARTHARGANWNQVQLVFSPQTPPAHAGATTAHSAAAGSVPGPVVTTGGLSSTQWNRLMSRVGTLPFPTVPSKPSSYAIADPRHRH
jgi:hypothetical protein